MALPPGGDGEETFKNLLIASQNGQIDYNSLQYVLRQTQGLLAQQAQATMTGWPGMHPASLAFRGNYSSMLMAQQLATETRAQAQLALQQAIQNAANRGNQSPMLYGGGAVLPHVPLPSGIMETPTLVRTGRLPTHVVVTCNKKKERPRYGVKMKVGDVQVRIGSRFADAESAAAVARVFREISKPVSREHGVFVADMSMLKAFGGTLVNVFNQWSPTIRSISVEGFLEKWITQFHAKRAAKKRKAERAKGASKGASKGSKRDRLQTSKSAPSFAAAVPSGTQQCGAEGGDESREVTSTVPALSQEREAVDGTAYQSEAQSEHNASLPNNVASRGSLQNNMGDVGIVCDVNVEENVACQRREGSDVPPSKRRKSEAQNAAGPFATSSVEAVNVATTKKDVRTDAVPVAVVGGSAELSADQSGVILRLDRSSPKKSGGSNNVTKAMLPKT
jgi:hypothetical protein